MLSRFAFLTIHPMGAFRKDRLNAPEGTLSPPGTRWESFHFVPGGREVVGCRPVLFCHGGQIFGVAIRSGNGAPPGPNFPACVLQVGA